MNPSPHDFSSLPGTTRGIPLKIFALFVTLIGALPVQALTWRQCQNQPDDWYKSEDAMRIADDVLLYQAEIGGWYKNDNSAHPSGHAATEELSSPQKKEHKVALLARKYPCTLDNDATHTEMRFLAKVHAATKSERYKKGFLKGVRYLLKAQYPSGGWPQFYPLRPGYSSRITINDGAMIGAMEVLDDVVNRRPPYDLADDALFAQCEEALAKGLACLLKCQIVVKGKPTAWCQQHHEITCAPAQGRISELPSLSGAESVGVARYLMSIDPPPPEVVRAVLGAARWFAEAKITGIKVVTVEDENLPGGKDRKVVKDHNAPAIWARYYEIGTNRPLFIEQGMVHYRLEDLSHKQRAGHGWIGGRWPTHLLEAEYPAWRKKWKERIKETK